MELGYKDKERKKQVHTKYKDFLLDSNKIIEFAKCFNINLDEKSSSDYDVDYYTFSDRWMPMVKIVDKKKNITYEAEYTGNAKDLLYVTYEDNRYIKQTITTNDYKILSYYRVGEDEPIIQRLSFTNDNQELSFEIETVNHEYPFFGNPYQNMVIRYTKNGEKLLTKYFGKREIDYEMKRNGIIVNGEEDYPLDQEYDTCFYKHQDGLIYRINHSRKPNMCKIMRGVCFENNRMNLDIDKYLPDNFCIGDQYKIMNSALMFQGKDDLGYRHFLEIYKYDPYTINIIYEIKARSNNDRILFENINVDADTLGKITTDELDNLRDYLRERYSTFGKHNVENKFLECVLNEIERFNDEVKTRDGIEKPEDDALTPKDFEDKSIDEIVDIVSPSKDYYIQLIADQHKAIISGNSFDTKTEDKNGKKLVKLKKD